MMSTRVPSNTNNQGYALQWWVNQSAGYFFAAGLHTNNIYVFLELDLVVVRNSTYTKVGTSSIRTEGKLPFYCWPFELVSFVLFRAYC